MASANEVKVSYIGDIRDLTEKLKSVTGITASEVRQQVAAVVAGQKEQAAAMRESTAAAKAFGTSAKTATTSLATGADKAAKAFGPLSGLISKVDPEMGAMSSAAAALTGTFDALSGGAAAAGISLGSLVSLAAPVAAGAALISAAYLTLTGNLDDAVMSMDAVDARNKAAAETAAATAEDVNRINSLRLALQDKVLIASGNETAATQTQRHTVEEINAAYREQIAIRERAVEVAIKAGDGSVTQARRNLAAINAERDALLQLAEQAATLKARDPAKEAEQAAAAAKASADLDKAGAANRLEISRQIRAQERADEKAMSDLRDKAAAEAIATTRRVADAELAAEDKRLAGLQKAKEAADAYRDSWLSASASVIGSVEQLAQATAQSYDTTTAAGRKAALAAWRGQKAAAVATAVALGFVAEAQAVASAPWPYNLPAIVEAGVASAASVAGAASSPAPQFHAGGRQAPDEVAATVLPGEQVVSRQGVSTFGAAGERANAGMSPAPSYTAIELKMRHQTMDVIMADTTRRGGQFAATLSGSRTVPFGHRSDTWRR